ncbi:hypothetical protein NL676_030622 [Syzygium grande]|nr:hypothetical protein NL676_030622 [Syzygium grande]
MQLGGRCRSQGPPKMEESETFVTRPGPTNRQLSPAILTLVHGRRRVVRPDLVGGGDGAAWRSRGRRREGYGPWRDGTRAGGDEPAIVEEQVGNADGGGGAGGER